MAVITIAETRKEDIYAHAIRVMQYIIMIQLFVLVCKKHNADDISKLVY